MNQTIEIIETIKIATTDIINLMEQGIGTEDLVGILNGYSVALNQIRSFVPGIIYREYEEFFTIFSTFCEETTLESINEESFNNIYSSLKLIIECMSEIKEKYETQVRVCPCCGKEVIYLPLPSYYSDMKKRSGAPERHGINETLNREKYLCPQCGSSDRDRMIVSFMKKSNLDASSETTRVLQVAPAKPIENWIENNCMQLIYETTDLFMKGVTYQSDIQDLKEIEDKKYDFIICSHVLEHVQDDCKAMAALKRVLKDDGMIAFLVPLDLTVEEIDEEWGLDEAENWRRFGQGDHCRNYSKKGLLERLGRYFHVEQLGKNYFGDEVFDQCGLTDTSVLYLLTKSEDVEMQFKKEDIESDVPTTGPVVSVVLSAYNHEKFVAQAVESVLNQTYKNIEFLVADDGSTDRTAEVMKQYSGKYASETYFEDNAGSRGAYLLQKATGKYIAIMHSDDIWEPEKIALQVHYMETHEKCGACFTWCKYTDDNLNELNDNVFIQKNRTQAGWIRFFYDHGNALSNPSSLIRKELYIGVDFVGCETRQLSDLFKWINLVQKWDIHIIPRVLIKMRRHTQTTSLNVSSVTKQNVLRHYLEMGAHWSVIIKNMDNQLFAQAFRDEFVDTDATDDDMECEKFFILMNSADSYVRYSAFAYLAEIYPKNKKNFEEHYHFDKKQLWDEEIKYAITLI